MNRMFHKNKRGVFFVLDILFAIVMFISFFAVLMSFSSQRIDVDNTAFTLTQSLYTALDNSQIVHAAITDASDSKLELFLNESISAQYCAQVLTYTSGGVLETNTSKGSCDYVGKNPAAAYGTIFVDGSLYYLEVYQWLI